ncbi:MAG: glycosyl hydrolase, partial [Bacteroidota bacterium]
ATGSERGVYKSTNGGTTWKKVLFANAETGAVDLIIDPNNPRVLYASTWKIRRTPYSLSSGGEGSALWKSNDYGVTWENISGHKGLPKGTWGISGITVSPQNSERLWAIIENKDGGVFRSDDAGTTWTKVNNERKLRQRAWYYTRIYADTENADKVYVVNVAYHTSDDGGKTFKSRRAPHGDHHDLWIAPENANRMIIGDDGGAQITYDGGETWSTYHNQPTSQFYRVTTDNSFPYRIYAAQQDNSTIRILHRSFASSITEDHWESTAGGESGHIAIDPLNNDIVYGGSYDGYLIRKDHKNNINRAINVWPDNPMGAGAEAMKYRFQWNFPLFFSPHDPKKLYTASNHLHVTKNEGQTWEIISPDLTRNDPEKLKSSGGPITQDNTSVEYYCTIFAACESERVKDLLWVGSDDGLVHVSKDGGANWENVTPNGLPEWTMINDIIPDPHDDGGAYIAATKYKAGDFRPYLFKTKDYGKTWTKIVNGIPAEHFTRAIISDPTRKGILYAGTESGMYISFDDGNNWQPFQLNLPIVPITDLAWKDNNLVASTQGRGLWIIDDLTVLHQADKAQNQAITLFKPMDSYRINGSQNKKAKNAGMNHPGGSNFYYYLKDYNKEEDTVSMTILEMNGDTIQHFSSHSKEKKNKLKTQKGSNHFNWNLKYEDATKFDGMIFWWGSLSGAKAIPGIYEAQLNKNGTIVKTSFNILPDPRTGLTMEDFKSQFDFIEGIKEKLTEAHETIISIRDARSQLKNYAKRVKGDEEIKLEVERIDSLMTDIETALYQTKNRSNQDPLNFPIKLTNKLAHLNSLTQMSDYPPTDAAIAVRNELVSKIDAELEKFEQIKKVDIKGFNDLIRRKQVDAIILE